MLQITLFQNLNVRGWTINKSSIVEQDNTTFACKHEMIILMMSSLFKKRLWCSGNIVAFQAIAMGSIPVRRIQCNFLDLHLEH